MSNEIENDDKQSNDIESHILDKDSVDVANNNVSKPEEHIMATDEQNSTTTKTNPLVILLQWLTYVFWGWLLLGIIYITFAITANALGETSASDGVVYGLVTVFVLYTLAAITDYFYSRKEPQEKTGVATIVMVIHAVIFALFTVGLFVSFLMAIVNGLLNGYDVDNKTLIISSLAVFPLYAFTFLRTILPKRLQKIRTIYRVGMGIVSSILLILAFIGPVASTYVTKNDRLIENNLPIIKHDIESYADREKKLPEQLNQLEISNNTSKTHSTELKKLLDAGLVEYKPNTKASTMSYQYDFSVGKRYFYYQLCANYNKPSEDYTDNTLTTNDDYNTYLTNYHSSGKVCYKLKAAVSLKDTKY